RDRPDEGHVAERVTGEHLAAQDGEPTDDPTGQGDQRTREVGVADEFVAQHQAATPGWGSCDPAPSCPRPRRTRRARARPVSFASRNTPKPSDVTKNPSG